MKTFLVVVVLDERSGLKDTFKIVCESISDPIFIQTLISKITRMGDDIASDYIQNALNDNEEPFREFSIYEISCRLNAEDVKHKFLDEFKQMILKSQETAAERQKERRRQDYERLRREFEK